MSDGQRAAAVAQLDQVEAESAEMLDTIVGRVRADLDAGKKDRTIIFAQLVVSVVNTFGMSKDGPGPYVFATAILHLADEGVAGVREVH